MQEEEEEKGGGKIGREKEKDRRVWGLVKG